MLVSEVSPDGHRIITVSQDNTVRVWSALLICCASQQEADQLATLAEAVSSNQVSDTGSLSVINGQELLQELNRHSGTGPAQKLSLNWIIRQFASGKNTE